VQWVVPHTCTTHQRDISLMKEDSPKMSVLEDGILERMICVPSGPVEQTRW